jgi:hypothetical protein
MILANRLRCQASGTGGQDLYRFLFCRGELISEVDEFNSDMADIESGQELHRRIVQSLCIPKRGRSW